MKKKSDVRTHEEADTLMIFHAKKVERSGMSVHIYSQDTDVLLFARFDYSSYMINLVQKSLLH